jgi:hypothetical protein
MIWRIAVLRQIKRGTTVLLFCGLGILVLGGCKVETKMSPEDKANFNGGPMPAGFNSQVSSPAEKTAPAAPGPAKQAPK